MQITQIRLKNFRAFQDVKMKAIPTFVILVGANGTGKSTLFSVFGFLREAMTSNVTTALAKLGGSRGFSEVRSRNSKGPIEIEIKFRKEVKSPIITYELHINEKNNQTVVEREILRYRRGAAGKPWHFLDFKDGRGTAVTNEMDEVEDDNCKGKCRLSNHRICWRLKDLLSLSDFRRWWLWET